MSLAGLPLSTLLGVAAAAGVALIVTAPRPAGGATLQPWVGLGSAGVRCRF